MINRPQLLKDLQRELPKIEKDILAYSEQMPERTQHLQDEYKKAVDAGRTAEHFVAWREAQITQAAVAWMLTCVFVRFMEDNGLLAEPLLAGPVQREDGNQPLKHAKERMVAYFNEHPTFAERHYLLDLFAQLEQFPVIAELLDHRHNPLWQIPVSADGAKALIDFFQKIDPATGHIVHDFTDANWDTRFLGDLYQDLSESVRKRYALLQTPEFVESFILDYTLEPAIQTFGVKGLRLIDPTCGSGHFLLTTFERVFEQWQKREPATNSRVLAQRALDVVHGTDINPYAIAICRFRLLIAAMKASGSKKIKDAPDFHFNLACGDSLLHGRRFEWQGQGHQSNLLEQDPIQHVLEVEDKDKLLKILGQQYHVVVGNPPYITVKDKALNVAYRNKYLTCFRKYSLGVPFTERFFELTMPVKGTQPSGFMGMITANSFMKREFGKKLIEEYLPRKDLSHIIDTSGAFIPGHGTPTVILFARNQQARTDSVRAVLGIRGEPSTPDDAALGRVWRSIVTLLEKPGSQNDFVSVVDQERKLFFAHPWSVGGGGVSELKSRLEEDSKSLSTKIDLIGFGAILGEDDAFSVPSNKILATQIPFPNRSVVEGDQVRDWNLVSTTTVVFPYDEKISLIDNFEIKKFLWPLRTLLWERQTFGKLTYKQAGRSFTEYHQIPVERNIIPLSITFAEVASHNHFVLDRGGRVFKQTAPIIKLPANATEADYLALLGFLNSSTVCFWMKQVSQQKQMTGGDGVRVESRAKVPYQFAGTALKKLPLPDSFDDHEFRQTIILLSEQADKLATKIGELSADTVLRQSLQNELPLDKAWRSALESRAKLRSRLILIQEELDWRIYHAYGLCNDLLLAEINQWSDVDLEAGQRPFEILAGANQDGFYVPSEVPGHWPESMRKKWLQRMQAITDIEALRLIEDPHYKRRWIGRQGLFNQIARLDELKNACRDWLLDQLEHQCQVADLQTVAQLTDRVRSNADFVKVCEFCFNSHSQDLQSLISDLVADDHVPQMAAARLKLVAMEKFRAWQETWDKQRIEDAIESELGVDMPMSEADDHEIVKKAAFENAQKIASSKKVELIGSIPVPPQYKPTDFRKPSYGSLRGKLDVPTERFFSLPGCEKDGDATLVIGWAGLNHLQRAQAIAAWYIDRKENDGWEANKLMPMLVALDELIPWLKQWHNDIDPEYGERMGDYYEGFLVDELRQLKINRDELPKWQPAVATRQRAARSRKVSAAE